MIMTKSKSKSKSKEKIPGTVEAWEDGSLGEDEDSAVLSDFIDMEILEESAGLQPISIRIQKSVLDDLKIIAKMEGMGYQPLIKNLLKRFVVAEQKKFYREHAPTMMANGPDDEVKPEPMDESRRKSA